VAVNFILGVPLGLHTPAGGQAMPAVPMAATMPPAGPFRLPPSWRGHSRLPFPPTNRSAMAACQSTSLGATTLEA
jgi:hypothetical protein